MAKQLTTFISNTPGALAAFCGVLKENGIDRRAMNVGIVRVIVSDTGRAKAKLEEQGYICQVKDVLVIEVEDHPGALVALLRTLGAFGVNLDYTYALFSRHEGTAGFVIKTENREEAVRALSEAGLRPIPDGEL